MNHSPPYAATIPANGTRFQMPATLAISDGSGSAQGTLATRCRVALIQSQP